MDRLKKLTPPFWKTWEFTPGQTDSGFNFRRKWVLIVLFTSLMVLLPLFTLGVIDFGLTQRLIEDEVKGHTLNVLDTVALAIYDLVETQEDPAAASAMFINQLAPYADSDIFIVDRSGVLVTPSSHFGSSGQPFDMSFATGTRGFEESTAPDGTLVLLGYVKPAHMPLLIVQAREKDKITGLWFKPRRNLIGYMAASIVVILLSIMGLATYLVGRIHSANRHWIEALQHEEQASRMASIGRMASGVAHEINNPLAIINQKAGLITDLISMDRSAAGNDRIRPLLDDIISAVTRCGSITRQLLDFARHMEPCIEQVEIPELLAQILPLIEVEAKEKHISVALNAPEDLPCLECDRSSLQQIFLNLTENAIEAMGQGGTLDIKVFRKDPDAIGIEVSDTGTGIPSEALNQIFEPFYTTKEEGWGAGLGLAITYGLVKEIGGDIRVKSWVNRGSRFTLTLPVKASPTPESKTGSLLLHKDAPETGNSPHWENKDN